jgi:hypothetical protein
MARGQFDIDGAARSGGESGKHKDDNQAEPAFRPLSSSRASGDQPAPREATVAHWRVAPSHSSAQQPAHPIPGSRNSHDQPRTHELERVASAQRSDRDGIAPRRGRRTNFKLLSLFFAVGIIIGIAATSTMSPVFIRSVRSLWAAARSDANLYMASSHESERPHGDASIENAKPPEAHASDPANFIAKGAGGNGQPDGVSSEQKLAEVQQRLDALEKALNALPRIPVGPPPRIAGEDGVPALSAQNAKTGDSGQNDAPLVQMHKDGNRAAVSVTADPADADRGNLNASHIEPEDSAVPSEQTSHSPVQSLPASAHGDLSGPRDARLRQDFEQFLNERQQTSSSPQDREKLFAAFKKLISKKSQANGLAGATSGSTRHIEIWQAQETTNLRELASAESKAIGEVLKGSTFHVIDRSKDGKWLKIETHDGSAGYYWAARARKMP